MKKIINIILIISLIISLIPMQSIAINSEQEFFDYLDSIGTRKSNSGNKVASYSTYKEYNLIVYGDPWGDTKPTGINGKTGSQKRYLGYTIGNDPYTNPYFPPDATSGNKPEDMKYVTVSGAIPSWNIKDTAQKSYMKTATLSGNGATSPSFNVNYIGGEAYAKVLSTPTWKSEGGFYVNHRSASGKIWYFTLTIPPMVGNTIVTGSISTPSNTYYIKNYETQVSIPVTVKAEAVKSGSARDTHISNISASFQGNSDSQKGKSNATLNSNFIATRANYSVGTHQIKLEGTVSLSTIFNDNDSSNVSKTITLIVEAEGENPYVTTTVTPDPAEKRFENKDIDVVLTVNGELHNYTKTSNVKEWVFYAREKEASSVDVKKVYFKTLNASTTFKFKIPASKVTEDTFKQYYVVRAEVVFNEKVQGASKVNGGWAISAPAEAVVVVYKDKPPTEPKPPKPSPSNPPTTKIYGATVVPAGEPTRYSAKASAAPGKRIEYAEFYSSVPPYKETDSKISYSFTKTFTMDDIGPDRLIEHIVEDNEGATASDFLLVEVTPPKPNGSLKFDGWLKEKRVVEIIDTSTSYGIPINDSRTRITITPEGDGATNNIRYLRTYRDIYDRSVREYIFNDGGTYNVEIYVENTSGISDTKTYNIVIEPDIPPIAEYSFSNKIYRDKNNNNFAKMEITDLSYSADYDKIVERTWTITYNANNSKDIDGFPNYSDDTSFQIKDSELEFFKEKTLVKNGFTYKITKIASDIITIQVNQVGNYLIELKVTEGYGMEGNTSHKHKTEKTITVLNREPFVDFEP